VSRWRFSLAVMLFATEACHGYYHSGQGRWMSRDPLTDPAWNPMRVSEPRGVAVGHAYGFVSNCPLSLYDAVGLFCGPCNCSGPDEWVVTKETWGNPLGLDPTYSYVVCVYTLQCAGTKDCSVLCYRWTAPCTLVKETRRHVPTAAQRTQPCPSSPP